MKSLFWQFFPPYEVKVLIESIEELLGKYSNLCRPVLEPEILTLAKDAKKIPIQFESSTSSQIVWHS